MSTHNFRLSCLVTMVTILLGSHISFTSARQTEKRDVYMGVEMQCRLHPRNCPADYISQTKREQSLLSRLRRIYSPGYLSDNIKRADQGFSIQDEEPMSLSSSNVRSASRSVGSYADALSERDEPKLMDMLRRL